MLVVPESTSVPNNTIYGDRRGRVSPTTVDESSCDVVESGLLETIILNFFVGSDFALSSMRVHFSFCLMFDVLLPEGLLGDMSESLRVILWFEFVFWVVGSDDPITNESLILSKSMANSVQWELGFHQA